MTTSIIKQPIGTEIITWDILRQKYHTEYELLIEYIKSTDHYGENFVYSVMNNLTPDERIEVFEELSEILRASFLTGFLHMALPVVEGIAISPVTPMHELYDYVQLWLRYVDNDQYERMN
jgi:hypothetical protein